MATITNSYSRRTDLLSVNLKRIEVSAGVCSAPNVQHSRDGLV